jgi:hypothetical protein
MTNADRQARFRKRREEEQQRLREQLEALRNAVPRPKDDAEPLLEEVSSDGTRHTMTLEQLSRSMWLQRAHVTALENELAAYKTALQASTAYIETLESELEELYGTEE